MLKMTGLRRYLRYPALALACFLAACQSVSPLGALRPGERSIELHVVPPRELLMVGVRRNMVSDILRYRVHLTVWDTTSQTYVELPTPIYKTLGPSADGTVSFNHLGPYKYRAAVVGENADSQTITTPQTADYDLTDPNGNFAAPLSRTVQMAMLPVVYAGSMNLPTSAATTVVPGNAQSLEVKVRDANNAIVAQRTYAPGDAFKASNLQAGVQYTLEGTATFPNGFVFTDTQPFQADATATSLAATIPLPAGFSLYPHYAVTQGATGLVADSQGGVWVEKSSSGTLEHLKVSATGTLTRDNTFTPSSQGTSNLAAMAADNAGGVWVVKPPALIHATPTNADFIATTVGATGNVIAPDGSGGVWVGTQNNTITHATLATADTANLTTVGLGAAAGAAVADGAGGVWVTAGASVRHATPQTPGNTTPAAADLAGLGSVGLLTDDHAGGAFVANSAGTSVAHLFANNPTSSLVGNFSGSATLMVSDQGGGFWWANGTTLGHTPASGTQQTLSFDNSESPLKLTAASNGDVWVLMAGGAVKKYGVTGGNLGLTFSAPTGTNPATFTLDALQRPTVLSPGTTAGRIDLVIE